MQLPPPPPAPPPPEAGGTDDGRGALPGARVTWSPWEAILVFAAAVVLAAVAGFAVGAVVRSRSVRFVAFTAVTELAFAVAVLFWVRVVHETPVGAVGASRAPLLDIGSGVVGGVALTVAAYIAGILITVISSAITGHAPSQPVQIPSYVTGAALAVSGVVVVFGAPLGEELLFRGFLYNALRKRWSVWPSALLSGALFAVLHASPVLILAILPVGVGLALIYERRRSILASMAAHATFNVIGFVTIVLSRR